MDAYPRLATFRSWSVVCALACLLPVAAEAQTVRLTSPGRISVDVSGMPLDELLLELSDVIEFEMLLVDREAEKRPVTAEIEDELVKDALLEILEAAKVNGIVMGEGSAFRMYAGSSAVMGSGRNVRSLLEEDSGGDARVEAGPVGQRQRRRQPGQRERQRRAATGDAALVVTGDASLSSRPETSRLAGVFALLWTGMLGGWVLVGGRRRF